MAEDSGSKSESQYCSFALNEQTHYSVLGVHPNASKSEIKSAWRARLLSCHPDKNHEADPCKFNRVMDAYTTLMDSHLRAEYDEKLAKILLPKYNYARIPNKMVSPNVSMKGRLVYVEWSLENEEEELQTENFVLEFKMDGYAVQQAYEGSSYHVLIEGLTCGWTYHFRICAINPIGAGEFSDWKSFKAIPTASIDELEVHTQEYVNQLHVAISTYDMDAIEQLLDRAGHFDVKTHFLDLLALAIDTLTQNNSKDNCVPLEGHRMCQIRRPPPAHPKYMLQVPQYPKSLL